MTTYEVGIVGAGVHGAAAAYHLAVRGVRTVVVERTTPAGGPTGLSSGICRAYYTNDFLARVARDAIDMFERFEEIVGADAGHRRTGLYLPSIKAPGATAIDVTANSRAFTSPTTLAIAAMTVPWPSSPGVSSLDGSFAADALGVAPGRRESRCADRGRWQPCWRHRP